LPQIKVGCAAPAAVAVDTLIKKYTGSVISEEAYQRLKVQEAAKQARLELAARVIEQDKPRRENEQEMKNVLHLIGLQSGTVKKVIKAPRRVLFPKWAEQSRKDVLAAFQYFLLQNPGCHHLVVTCGRRIPVKDVASTLRAFSDKLRRLRDRKWFNELAEIVMKSAEFTCKNGEFHCHIHLVIKPLRPVSEQEWIGLTGDLGKALDTFVSDDGPVTNCYGLGKYLVKAEGSENADPFEMGELCDQLKHFRSHEPQGGFRGFCQTLRREGRKIKYVGGALVPVDIEDGCRRQESHFVDEDTGTIPTPDAPTLKHKRKPLVNFLLRITPPYAHSNRVREPYLLVLNFDGDFHGYLQQNPKLAKYREELMPQWFAGMRLINGGSNVHVQVQVTARPADPANWPGYPTSAQDGYSNEFDPDDADFADIGVDPDHFLFRPVMESKLPGWMTDSASFPI
jgi:hypothetical protein